MVARALSHGFDRIEDFLAVQSPAITVEAVKLLQRAVDVDDAERAVIAERVAALVADGHSADAGSVLLGVLVTLFALGPLESYDRVA